MCMFYRSLLAWLFVWKQYCLISEWCGLACCNCWLSSLVVTVTLYCTRSSESVSALRTVDSSHTGPQDHVSLPPIEGSKRGASYRTKDLGSLLPHPAVDLPWTSMSVTASGHALPALVMSTLPPQQQVSNYGYLYELVSEPLEIQVSTIPSYLVHYKTQLTRILETHHGAFGHSCTGLDLPEHEQNTM
jgi:hypothetical protein